MYRFRATIEKGKSGPNSWCFVTVPTEIVRQLNGSRRISGTIESEPFDGSLIAHAGGAKAVLVTRELRDALQLAPGQEIEVALAADSRSRPVEVPDELAAALEGRPDVARTFAALAPSHRREYAEWIAQAKKSETKAARVERALGMIAEKGRLK